MAKILCVDFDGVLHSYTSGWKGEDVVSDPPVPGAMLWLIIASTHFQVHIFSSRSYRPEGIAAMKAAIKRWLLANSPETGHPYMTDANEFVDTVLQWPTSKPAAFLTLDDRAIQFTGTFPRPDELVNFKTWMQK